MATAYAESYTVSFIKCATKWFNCVAGPGVLYQLKGLKKPLGGMWQFFFFERPY